MLSKLASKQLFNHGLRLTTRALSISAQSKPIVDRKPSVKYHKVSLSVKINDYKRFTSFFQSALAFYQQ